MDVFLRIYYKLPRMFQHYISRWRYKPQIGKGVDLAGWSTFSRNVKIGDYSYLMQNQYMANVEIGKFCCIAANLSVGLNEHPYTSFSNYRMNGEHSPFRKRKFGKDISNNGGELKKTVIGNDVWIGQDVTIKSGVVIGDGAVIGARAMVTKDVPPYAIVAGVPARIIRYRFSQEKIDYLQRTRWWDLPLENLWEKIEELDRFGADQTGEGDAADVR